MTTIRASKLPRLALCPASYWAQQGLADKSTDESKSGDAVHDALALYFGSPECTYEIAEKTLTGRETIVFRWFAGNAETILNQRGGMYAAFTELAVEIPDLLTGHIDMLAQAEDGSFHIFDWKTGHLSVETAESNMQLRGYAVSAQDYLLRKEGMTVTEIFCHMFSAGNEEGETFSTCRYRANDLEHARKQIKSIHTAVFEGPRTVRNPSLEACRYCKALGNPSRCPESIDAYKPIEIDGNEPPTAEMVPELVRYWDLLELAHKARDQFRDYLVTTLAQHDVPDLARRFRLTDGKERVVVTNAVKAREIALRRMLMTEDEFTECVSVSADQLRDKCKDAFMADGQPVKDHKQYFKDVFKQCLKIKRDKQSVRRATTVKDEDS